ncbi:MAG: hypothetical protein E7267_07410 [Lachnospiraceae bacterium]|nr:hypothetical protein [Lachnospiraceae bacterium]
MPRVKRIFGGEKGVKRRMMKQIRNSLMSFMNKYIMDNIWYKVLSLGIAVMVWLVILNMADPITTRSFNDLEVQIINQSAITSINQVYEVIEGDTVNFTVKGKSSIVNSLKITDFTAYADLSKLSPVYAADIVVKCDVIQNVEIDTGNRMLKVKLEDVATKNVQVAVETTGEVADGYYVDNYEVRPNIVTITGGASKISKIASVKVNVSVSGAHKNFVEETVPIALDENGNEIDSSFFTYYNKDNELIDIVSVKIFINNTKTIPVKLDVIGEPGEGYVYNGEFEYAPETILIGGSNKALSQIESVTIPVDITGIVVDSEFDFDIQKYLPDKISLVSSEKNVAVRVKLDVVEYRTIDIAVSDIEIRNLAEGMSVEYFNPNEVVKLRVKGTAKQIEGFTKDSVGAYIDLTNVAEGMASIPVMYNNITDEYIDSEPYIVRINVNNAEVIEDDPI